MNLHICFSWVLRSGVVVLRVVNIAAVEQAAGGPLSACARRPWSADKAGSCLAFGKALDHSRAWEAVGVRDGRTG